ncbi:hypothetical protein ADUPG1_008258 [Aduncisulcus paluster]|uniref:Uncharacterized protein n=1 Tax=Aduncisulcus paluster TaxID=2918883 RepID=A0ABQ5KRA7_9EUKA|nr:hypothetical protein ADUPG1_008258 [Aduncisulcus paluster]
MNIPTAQEDTNFLRSLRTRTTRADIVAHSFGTGAWQQTHVFDIRVTELTKWDNYLQKFAKDIADGNRDAGSIVETGSAWIQQKLIKLENDKNELYKPETPSDDPSLQFVFFPLILSSHGVIGPRFQEFLSNSLQCVSEKGVRELKTVLARSLAYGNALNRHSYELRCSGASSSHGIFDRRFLFPFTRASAGRARRGW